jgi:copper transport protein
LTGPAPNREPANAVIFYFREGHHMTTDNLVQFLHLLVSVIWIGGMIYTKFVFVPALAAVEPAYRGQILGVVAKRFTLIAWGSVAILLITGLLKTPGGMLLDTSTEFGRLLLVKHILFALMILIGGIITFGVAPRLRSFAPGAGERPSESFVAAQRRLEFLSGTNMILGIAVLLIISMF